MFLAKCNVRALRPTLNPTDDEYGPFDALGWGMPPNNQPSSPTYMFSQEKILDMSKIVARGEKLGYQVQDNVLPFTPGH